jgi:2-dehydro-3-deoxyphosphogluconate aldolase/(4S)-4-hydroxy-2-oxoglutarate aldolase
VLNIASLLERVPVVPVLTLEDGDAAVRVARGLCAGGLPVLEVTLRTPSALSAIERLRTAVPDAIVGAGTIRSARQLAAVREAGALFAVSPGVTPALLEAAVAGDLPLLPGVATVSEAMLCLDAGFTCLKFFPAAASGGVAALRAFQGPLPDVRFCPTGGITLESAPDYLALDNVVAVGGSWLSAPAVVAAGDETAIREAAAATVAALAPR